MRESWARLCSQTVVALKGQLDEGEITSQEVTQAYLASIAHQNPRLNAYVDIYDKEALQEAQASDARRKSGRVLSALDGIPIALKDNLLVEGRRCTCASQMLLDFAAPYDATAVARLKAAGMPLLGKLNMDEFAMGSSGETSLFGPARNPWDEARVPGGSSGGGAVAVAAGMAPAALGSDTGGSIRQPASFCGVVGVRPAYGTVSRYGLVAFASSLDQIGPLCKTAFDAALVMNVIAGADPRDATSRGGLAVDFAKGLAAPMAHSSGQTCQDIFLGVPVEAFGQNVPKNIRDALGEAVTRWQALGAQVREVSLPWLEEAVAAYYILSSVEAASNLARYDGIRYGHQAQEAGDLERRYRQSRSEGFGLEVKRRIWMGTAALQGNERTAAYWSALQVRERLKQEMAAVFSGCNALLTPVNDILPWKRGKMPGGSMAVYGQDRWNAPVSLLGLPALVLPCALVAGLPMGMGLTGPRESLPGLLAMANAYERAYPVAMGMHPYDLLEGGKEP